jgi:hypothetical protein
VRSEGMKVGTAAAHGSVGARSLCFGLLGTAGVSSRWPCYHWLWPGRGAVAMRAVTVQGFLACFIVCACGCGCHAGALSGTRVCNTDGYSMTA